LRSLEDRLEREDAIVPELILLAFEECPVDVDRNGTVSRRLDLLEHIETKIENGEAEGVELAAEDHQTLAVDEHAVVIPSDNVLVTDTQELGFPVGTHGAGMKARSQGQADGEDL
jgi:predicted nucleic acid-binding protein